MQTHFQVNEKMLPSWHPLGSGGCNFPFANAKAAPIQSAILCFDALRRISIEKNLDFLFFSPSLPTPTLLLTYTCNMFLLCGDGKVKEKKRRWCQHFVMWQDMNTSNLIFYEIINKITPMLNSKFSSLSICMLSRFSRVWLFETPMDCSSPGSFVHGILQARMLKWVAIPFSRGSSWIFLSQGSNPGLLRCTQIYH